MECSRMLIKMFVSAQSWIPKREHILVNILQSCDISKLLKITAIYSIVYYSSLKHLININESCMKNERTVVYVENFYSVRQDCISTGLDCQQ